MRESRDLRTGLSLLLPGAVLLVMPGLILLASGWPRSAWDLGSRLNGLLSAAGLALVGGGLTLMSATIRLFHDRGEGTLAPWDPPLHLVVRGIYRHVRNPMHTGLFGVLFGEGILLRSAGVLVLAAVVVWVHLLYIPLFEERGLEQRFGEAYRDYKRHVPRWIPKLRPWEPEAAGIPKRR
jgi:protein-S-isoprenylcysteine O-methyltransferase Ste14